MSRAGRIGVLVALVLALGLVPDRAGAQRLTGELTGGATVGSYSETGANLDVLPGPAFGARLELWLTESLAGYAGYTRSSFGCEESFCSDRDVSLTSQGVVLGARWAPGLPWIRAGLTLQALGIRADGGEESVDPGFGVEAGAGVEIPIGGRVRFRPGLTYLRHGTSSSLGDGHVSALGLELGVAFHLATF